MLPNDTIEGLISDIAIALGHIKELSEEFTHQAAEMLSVLDKPPPQLSAKRDVMSAAWAAAGALAERADGRVAKLERLIGQAHRGE